MIAANAVNGVKGGLGSSYLMTILNNFSGDILADRMPVSAQLKSAGFEIIPRYWFNPTLKYVVFMIPALMMMVLAIVSGFLPAMNIVGEKEAGTLNNDVYACKPLAFYPFEAYSYWVVCFVVLTIAILWHDGCMVQTTREYLHHLPVCIDLCLHSGFGL